MAIKSIVHDTVGELAGTLNNVTLSGGLVMTPDGVGCINQYDVKARTGFGFGKAIRFVPIGITGTDGTSEIIAILFDTGSGDEFLARFKLPVVNTGGLMELTHISSALPVGTSLTESRCFEFDVNGNLHFIPNTGTTIYRFNASLPDIPELDNGAPIGLMSGNINMVLSHPSQTIMYVLTSAAIGSYNADLSSRGGFYPADIWLRLNQGSKGVGSWVDSTTQFQSTATDTIWLPSSSGQRDPDGLSSHRMFAGFDALPSGDQVFFQFTNETVDRYENIVLQYWRRDNTFDQVLKVGKTVVDVTTKANSASASTFKSFFTPVNSFFYVGYRRKWETMQTFYRAGELASGKDSNYAQYWDGSKWKNVALVADDSIGHSFANGDIDISAPGDWATLNLQDEESELPHFEKTTVTFDISYITSENPARVYLKQPTYYNNGTSLADGALVTINGVSGDLGTTLNGNTYTVTGNGTYSFQLTGADTSGDARYTFGSSGGTVTLSWANITGVTNTDPVEVTLDGHMLRDGDIVTFSGVGGTTELNGNTYFVLRGDAAVANKETIFRLFDPATGNSINGTAFGVYTSGGSITRDGRYWLRYFTSWSNGHDHRATGGLTRGRLLNGDAAVTISEFDGVYKVGEGSHYRSSWANPDASAAQSDTFISNRDYYLNSDTPSYLYIGHTSTFTSIDMNITSGASAMTLYLEYFDTGVSRWLPMTFTDGSSNLSTTGSVSLTALSVGGGTWGTANLQANGEPDAPDATARHWVRMFLVAENVNGGTAQVEFEEVDVDSGDAAQVLISAPDFAGQTDNTTEAGTTKGVTFSLMGEDEWCYVALDAAKFDHLGFDFTDTWATTLFSDDNEYKLSKFEYWNGSRWKGLQVSKDETNKTGDELTGSESFDMPYGYFEGSGDLEFTEPGDWAQASLQTIFGADVSSDTTSRYWLRFSWDGLAADNLDAWSVTDAYWEEAVVTDSTSDWDTDGFVTWTTPLTNHEARTLKTETRFKAQADDARYYYRWSTLRKDSGGGANTVDIILEAVNWVSSITAPTDAYVTPNENSLMVAKSGTTFKLDPLTMEIQDSASISGIYCKGDNTYFYNINGSTLSKYRVSDLGLQTSVTIKAGTQACLGMVLDVSTQSLIITLANGEWEVYDVSGTGMVYQGGCNAGDQFYGTVNHSLPNDMLCDQTRGYAYYMTPSTSVSDNGLVCVLLGESVTGSFVQGSRDSTYVSVVVDNTAEATSYAGIEATMQNLSTNGFSIPDSAILKHTSGTNLHGSSIVKLSSGRMVLGMRKTNVPSILSAWVRYSDDNGTTWTEATTPDIAIDSAAEQGSCPALIDLGNNASALVYATLNGSSEYFSAGDILNPGTNDYNFSVRINTTVSGNNLRIPLCQKTDGTFGYEFSLETDGSGNFFMRFRQNISGGTAIDVSSPTLSVTVNDGNWHNLAWSVDRNGFLIYYVDGASEGSDLVSSASGDNITVVGSFYVGASDNFAGGGVVDFADVSLYDARFEIATPSGQWNQPIVDYHFQNPLNYTDVDGFDTALSAAWSFHDAASATNGDADGMITDDSGNGLHLDAVGGVTTNYGTHTRTAVAGIELLAFIGGNEVNQAFVLRSWDAGVTWTKLRRVAADFPGLSTAKDYSFSAGFQIASGPSSGRVLVATHELGGVDTARVHYSDDNGVTWLAPTTDLPAAAGASAGPRRVYGFITDVDATPDPDTLYVLAFESGISAFSIFKTTDGADNWVYLQKDTNSVTAAPHGVVRLADRRIAFINADGKLWEVKQPFTEQNNVDFTTTTITRNDSGSFVVDGWETGFDVTVTGSVSNNSTFTISGVAHKVLTITGGTSETGSGGVTVTMKGLTDFKIPEHYLQLSFSDALRDSGFNLLDSLSRGFSLVEEPLLLEYDSNGNLWASHANMTWVFDDGNKSWYRVHRDMAGVGSIAEGGGRVVFPTDPTAATPSDIAAYAVNSHGIVNVETDTGTDGTPPVAFGDTDAQWPEGAVAASPPALDEDGTDSVTQQSTVRQFGRYKLTFLQSDGQGAQIGIDASPGGGGIIWKYETPSGIQWRVLPLVGRYGMVQRRIATS